jgi:hypothetical protein
LLAGAVKTFLLFLSPITKSLLRKGSVIESEENLDKKDAGR